MRWPVATGRRLRSGDGPGKGTTRPARRPDPPEGARSASGWCGPRGACGRPGVCAAAASARAAERSRPRRRAAGRGPWASPRRRGRATRTRRRYSATRGGRALALGEPAARTREQRVCTSDTLAGLGRRRVMRILPVAATRPAAMRLVGARVDGEDEAPAAGAELELLLEVEDVVGAAAARGRAPAAAPRCGRPARRGRGPGSRRRARSTRARRVSTASSGVRDRRRAPGLDPRGTPLPSPCGLLPPDDANGPTGTGARTRRPGCSPRSCAAAPRSTPTATTCAWATGPWRSYGEVNARANRVANALIARGLRPGRGGLDAAAELRGEPGRLVRHPEGRRRPVPDQPGLPGRLPVVGAQPAAVALPGDRRLAPRARWRWSPATSPTWSA